MISASRNFAFKQSIVPRDENNLGSCSIAPEVRSEKSDVNQLQHLPVL
jgi:hypothetical protein